MPSTTPQDREPAPRNDGPDASSQEGAGPARARQPLRFHRRLRLVRAADFTRVYREGSRAKGSLMTVAVVANGLDHSRLGLSIGKRCWKGAVGRNRVRRVFREAFRTGLPELPSGLDIVLIGSTPRIRPHMLAAREELIYLAKKASRRYREKTKAAPPK